ncbi:site-2 protease family protein, partial [Campylobacter coli]
INLGILNLLPIPMLDGGHILFNLYEMIFRRKVPPRAFEYLSYVGMAYPKTVFFKQRNKLIRFIKSYTATNG